MSLSQNSPAIRNPGKH